MRSFVLVGLCGTALGVPWAHPRRLQKSGAEEYATGEQGPPLCVVDELAQFWDSGSEVVDVNGLAEVLCSDPPELDVSTCSDAELASIAEAQEAMCISSIDNNDPAPPSCYTDGCADPSIACPCGCWPSGLLLAGGRAGTPCSCYNPICMSIAPDPPDHAVQPGEPTAMFPPDSTPPPPIPPRSPPTLACKQATCSDWCATHACEDRRPCPIGEFVAQCDELGGFMPVQCDGLVGNCWCVDEQGEEIAGTNMMCRGACAVTVDGCLVARKGNPSIPGHH